MFLVRVSIEYTASCEYGAVACRVGWGGEGWGIVSVRVGAREIKRGGPAPMARPGSKVLLKLGFVWWVSGTNQPGLCHGKRALSVQVCRGV